MTDKKSNESRRKLLKSIAAGGGAVIAGKSLPENWSRPVVDSVLLPAHALTSNTSGALNNANADQDNPMKVVLDTLVPESHADISVEIATCVSLNLNRSVKVESLIDNGCFIKQAVAAEVWIGGDPVQMTESPCNGLVQMNPLDLLIQDAHALNGVTTVRVKDISNGWASIEYVVYGDKVPYKLPQGPCTAPQCPKNGVGALALKCG
jgi:hypothetical protein